MIDEVRKRNSLDRSPVSNYLDELSSHLNTYGIEILAMVTMMIVMMMMIFVHIQCFDHK